MKTLCTLALLILGLALPGCVRSVGLYRDYDRHFDHAYYGRPHYHHGYYRPAPRPYSPFSQSFGQPRYDRHPYHHHRHGHLHAFD